MDKYKEFPMIDTLARNYGYTHAEAFNLSWREAYTIIALNRETAYIEAMAQEMKRKADGNS